MCNTFGRWSSLKGSSAFDHELQVLLKVGNVLDSLRTSLIGTEYLPRS